MASPYRGLFATPGAKGFTLAGLFSRLPIAMFGLAVVIMISELTGSYATAGAVTMTAMGAYTILAPFASRMVDRYGQFRVLLPQVGMHFVGLAGLMTAAELGAPVWTLFLFGIVTGGSRPTTGSMVRTRWRHALNRHGSPANSLQAAFAFESVVDEIIFIVGPILVTWLAIGVHHLAGLLACLVLTVSGTTALALQRGSEPPVQHAKGQAGSPLTVRGMPFVIGVMLPFGVVVGAVDLVTIAYAEFAGSKAAAGPILGVFAAGSMLAGLWYGGRAWRASLRSRWSRCLVLFAAGQSLLIIPAVTAAGGLVLLGGILFISGSAIAPLMITGVMIVERLLPARMMTEGMTWISTSIVGGVAAGGGAAGWLVDALGPGNAFALPVACSIVALAVGAVGTSRLTATDDTDGDGPGTDVAGSRLTAS